MKRLWIFNPETEFALASGSVHYTPPRNIIAVRKRMALFPAMFANPGDAILVMDGDKDEQMRLAPEYYAEAVTKGIDILTPESKVDWNAYIASPWGWNPMIRKWLIDRCIGLNGILTDVEVDGIRRIAHRRTSIQFLATLPEKIRSGIQIPVEIFDVEQAIKHYHIHKNLFIKTPWSSSGRGVMRTDDLLPIHVEPWIRGAIRSQGSVIMEPIYDKALDFATEWEVTDGNANYLGVSVFEASDRGKYHRNFTGTQCELLSGIYSLSSYFNPELIESQAMVIEKIIAPDYSGPLGIDMMVLKDGTIHPCVEINLRHTMGSVLLKKKSEFF